jgi:hypothetical protein
MLDWKANIVATTKDENFVFSIDEGKFNIWKLNDRNFIYTTNWQFQLL